MTRVLSPGLPSRREGYGITILNVDRNINMKAVEKLLP
jgi:hypothetical protein